MNSFLKFNHLVAATAIVACSLGLQSCQSDDDSYVSRYPNALVTVKPVDGNSFFLQLDEKTTLRPTNVKSSPYGSKEVRALVNYSEVNESGGAYSKAVHINWIDSILTKKMAVDLGAENDKTYGTDPVEILNDWVTIAEDGYLTLRFSTVWGGGKAHFVNLLPSQDPTKPYEVEFRHNAYGDIYGTRGYGLVAFNLSELPDTGDNTVKLKLKWKSFSGDKSAEFNYSTRKATPAPSSAITERSVFKLK